MEDGRTLPERAEIRRPGDLHGLLRSLRAALAAGDLVQVAGNCRPEDVVEGGTWPADFLEMTFRRTSDGAAFRLDCEVYHGFGGIWSRDIVRALSKSRAPRTG